MTEFYQIQITVQRQNIPIAKLKIQLLENTQQYSESILENEIKGIIIERVAITGENAIIDYYDEAYRTIYLFVLGKGNVTIENLRYEITPETILLPNIVRKTTISAAKNDTIHYLKITCKLSDQDLIDLKKFPTENTQNIYYAKFTDCRSYTEAIKSPNTTSRTILPNKFIPRVAMGTVQTKGQDKVGAHEHPMLEQLFLGLSKNNCVVFADDAKVDFPEYSILHIPLGSRHSVAVEEDEIMYYVWMDFFLNKKAEEWLKTHKENGDN